MTALVLASFDREAPFRAAAGRAGAAYRVVGLWSPYPVEIEGVEAEAARPIAPVAIAVGLAAAASFYLFIWWSATRGYAFDSGGRPLHSWPVFLIAPIEFGALAAGLAGMIAFLVRARLTRLNDAAFDLDEVEDALIDRFVLALACDAGEDANAALALLAEAGAVHSRLVAR